MNPAEWLLRSARRTPSAPALLTGTNVVADYATFAARATCLGSGLRDRHGIRPGDRVALFAKNRTEYLEALYGIWFAGAVAVPVNGKLHPAEAAWIVADSGSRLVFADPGAVGELASLCPDATVIPLAGPAFAALTEAEPDRERKPNITARPAMGRPPDPGTAEAKRPACTGPRAGTPTEKPTSGRADPHPTQPDDLVWLFYTSGTTGKPKGVMLTSANVTAMALGYEADVDRVEAGDAILYAAPMSHGAGLYNFMYVMRGARHAVPVSGGFDAHETLDLAAALGRVSMFAAPTIVRRLVDAARTRGDSGAGLKSVIYGGGPMYVADIMDAVEVMGPRFVQIYGQGECPMAISVLSRDAVADRDHPAWRARLGSVGCAQSTVRIAVADADGHPLPAGEVGEVLVQGLPVMRGYWNRAEATAKALTGGWLHTGDMGSLDADGFLTLHDRSKDVIISGGTNIYPREVEEALLTHPAVHEVSVVGCPDPEWGESVVAFVVLSEGASATEAALDDHCLTRIARFKRPKRYVFAADLPKNNYGKVLKTDLRARLVPTDD